jgi:hypothetical protein
MNIMNRLRIKWILLSMCFCLFISCNGSQDNQNEDNAEDIENQSDNNNEIVSDFDTLEKKMDHIMNESEDVDGKTHKDVTIIKSNGAKEVEVNLKIGAGKLKLSSGSSELFTGGFIFTDEEWKPEVDYKVKGNKGFLVVKQPDSENYDLNNDDKYAWNLKFTENIPLSFDIELGAGMSEIILNDLQIVNFDMNMGVGKTEIDMRGKWKKNAEIHLDGGIGLSIIHLPDNVGVILDVEKGLGSVEVRNMLKKDNSKYVNGVYEKSNITLKIYLKTGIGKIEVD